MYSMVPPEMRKIADPEKHCIYLLFYFFTFLIFGKLLKQPPSKR